MRRTAVPAIALGVLVLAVVGEAWLLQHQLRLAVYVALGGLLAMLVAAFVALVRGRRGWTVGLLAVVLLIGAATAGYAWNLDKKLNDISRITPPAGFSSGRPQAESDPKTLNLLLLGADNPDPSPDKPTVAELLRDGTWDSGAYRSDSIMLVHLPADRRSATVVSIPRDSYVTILDGSGQPHGKNKINAAFSEFGPFGTVRTVEALTGMRIQHLAIIDFEGFRDLTTALGGVDVYVPQTVYDPKRHQNWPKGWNHIEGGTALNYVRMRYGLTYGDFDRVARQQNFLRALLGKLTDDGTLGNPITVQNTVDAIVPYLTVDSGWTNGQIRSLALGLTKLHTDEIRYVTVGKLRYETIDGVGMANILDDAKDAELWAAVKSGRIDEFLAKYPQDGLGDSRHVS